MRKITSILSMFLLIAGWNTASAQFAFKKLKAVGEQVTQLSQLVNGHYYVFKSNNKEKFIKLDKETMQFVNDRELSEGDNSDGLAVFKLHVDESTDTYSFESARGGYYMPKVGVNAPAYATDATSPAQFVIKTTDKNNATRENCWAIKNSADNAYFDMQDGQFVGWDGSGDNTWYEIYDVTLSDVETDLQIVYKVVERVNGTDFPAAYGLVTTGETYNSYAPADKSYYLTLAKEPENKIITKENMTLVYEYTGTAPFNVGQWYSLKIGDGPRVLRAVAEENNLYVNTDKGSTLDAIANTYPNFLNALWRIEESGLGVKIYNKAVGKYLKGNGVGNSKGNRATFDNTGTVFYVKSINGGLGFYTGSGYLNACCPSSSTGANTRLGLWNAAGNGSTFYCEKNEDDLLALGKTAFANTPDVYSYTSNNALIKGGNYSGNKSSAAAATTLDGLFEIGDNVSKSNEANPETGVYYLIRNVREGAVGTNDEKNKYLSSEFVFCDTDGKIQTKVGETENDRNIKRTKNSSPLLPRLWQFEEATDGKFYLRNVNTQKYVALGDKFEIPTDQYQSYKTAFSLEATNVVFGSQFHATNDATTMFLMGAQNTFINAESGMGADANGVEYNGVTTWTDITDGGNYWQLIKVTEVPLNIAANDYTTLCLPFNVKLPENSTVKAYYASAAAGKVLKLTEITGGIIPANEGVILQNTGAAEAAINLTITTDEATTLTDNRLVGVTAKREGYAVKSNYVLADGNKGIGFYKANFTAIPANKAYLPSENIMNAQGVMMAFSFGDEVTGIDNVNAAAPAAKKYYDLQGRRVLYPAKGIFVTEDGQKVLFK